MVIKLSPELEAALNESARRQGVTPEVLANKDLTERFLSPAASLSPQDEWERTVLGLATDCGVSRPHSALSSDDAPSNDTMLALKTSLESDKG